MHDLYDFENNSSFFVVVFVVELVAILLVYIYVKIKCTIHFELDCKNWNETKNCQLPQEDEEEEEEKFEMWYKSVKIWNIYLGESVQREKEVKKKEARTLKRLNIKYQRAVMYIFVCLYFDNSKKKWLQIIIRETHYFIMGTFNSCWFCRFNSIHVKFIEKRKLTLIRWNLLKKIAIEGGKFF